MSERDGRLPPQNIDAEERVLGAILIDPAALPDVRRILRPEDFYRRSHRLIFEAMRQRADLDDGHVDIVTVADELRRTGKIEEAGGPEAVACLADDVSTSRRVAYWARIVAECAAKRGIIERLNAGLERAWGDGISSDDLAAGLRDLAAEHFALLRRDGVAAAPLAEIYHALPPRPTPIVEDLVFPGNCGFIGADAGAGKTTTADDMAIAVASGFLVWGKFGVPKPRNVLWIQMEDPILRHGDRLMRLARGRGLADIPANIYTWDRSAFFMDDPRDMADLYSFIKEHDIGLVLADPFVYMHGLDENSNQEMARLLRPVKVEFKALDCALLIIHHNKHADPKYRGPVEVGRIRGASFLLGFRDSLLTLQPAGPQVRASFYVKDTGRTHRFLLYRDFYQNAAGEDCERIEYREADDGPMVRPDSNPDRLLRAIESLEADEDGWVHVAVAAERAGIRHRATINRTVKSLARAGHIDSQPGSGRTPARVRLLGEGKAEQGEMRYADAEEEQF